MLLKSHLNKNYKQLSKSIKLWNHQSMKVLYHNHNQNKKNWKNLNQSRINYWRLHNRNKIKMIMKGMLIVAAVSWNDCKCELLIILKPQKSNKHFLLWGMRIKKKMRRIWWLEAKCEWRKKWLTRWYKANTNPRMKSSWNWQMKKPKVVWAMLLKVKISTIPNVLNPWVTTVDRNRAVNSFCWKRRSCKVHLRSHQ